MAKTREPDKSRATDAEVSEIPDGPPDATGLTPRQRKTLFDHTLRSQSGAMSTLHPYEVASP